MSAAGAATLADITGYVHSWDVATGVDGPGTRFVAFLAGCPLRCLYCHNPDTWTHRGAEHVDAETLLSRIDRYRRFIAVSGGGVTLSGGEPLMQPAFVEAVFTGCAERGLHTALDTAGPPRGEVSESLLDLVDLVLLDIKTWGADRYRALTGGGDLEQTLRFARRLGERGQPTWLRYVVVPGHNDDPSAVEGVAGFAATLGCVERVDVLPMHRLATAKYDALGLRYPVADLEPPGAAAIERVRATFAAHGLTAV